MHAYLIFFYILNEFCILMSHFVFGNMLWNLFWNNLHSFWYKDCCFSYFNFSILLTGLRLFQWLCFSHLIMICLKSFLGFLEFLPPPPQFGKILALFLQISHLRVGFFVCFFEERNTFDIVSALVLCIFFPLFFFLDHWYCHVSRFTDLFFPAICYLFLISFTVFISDNYFLSVEVLFFPFLFSSCYCFPLPVLTFRAYL